MNPEHADRHRRQSSNRDVLSHLRPASGTHSGSLWKTTYQPENWTEASWDLVKAFLATYRGEAAPFAHNRIPDERLV